MKPIRFKEVNIEFAKDQPEYNTLPAYRDQGQQGEVITCWKLSFKERFRILFGANIWLCLLSFHKPLTPSFMSTKKSDVIETTNSN